MSRAVWVCLVAVALCVFLFAWALLHHGSLARKQLVDTPVYQTYGDMTARGGIPYRDFRPEYPPLALPVFVLPSLGHEGDRPAYERWFDREMALCAGLALIGTALCLRALRAGFLRTSLALLVFAASPVLIGSVVRSRFDWWPAALAVFALAALLYDRRLPAAVLLAAATGAKLWPAALIPLFVIWAARTHGRRAAQSFAVVTIGVLAMIFVPFAVVAPGGLGHSFHAQFARPLQIESLGSAVLIAVHEVTGASLHIYSAYGSQNVTGWGTDVVAALTSAVGAAALVAVWVFFGRGPATAARLATSSAAAVTALIAFGKVFSPQFVIWFVPFVLLVAGVRGLAAGGLLIAVLVLTHAWFPQHYWDLATGFAPTQDGELLARDLAVVALLGVLAWPGLQHEIFGEHRTRLEALQRVRAQVD